MISIFGQYQKIFTHYVFSRYYTYTKVKDILRTFEPDNHKILRTSQPENFFNGPYKTKRVYVRHKNFQSIRL